MPHYGPRLGPALRRAGIAYRREKGTRRIIHLCKAREKTSGMSGTSENRLKKDDQDVSDDVSPSLHDVFVTEGGTVIGGELTQQAVAMEIASIREEEQLAVAREIAAIREEERKWKEEQERNRKKKEVSGTHPATPEEKLHL
jgi:hypothetical protein